MSKQQQQQEEVSGNLLKMLMDQAEDLEMGNADASKGDAVDPKSLIVEGYEISKLFAVIEFAFQNANNTEEGSLLHGLGMMNRSEAVKAVNGTFMFEVTSKKAKEPVRYYVEMRREGKIQKVEDPKSIKPKPDVTLRVSDKDMVALATGQMNPQMAFMKGRIKVKGNVMLGLRMQTVLMKEVAKMGRQSKL